MAQARAQTEEEAANLALSRVRQPGIADFSEQNTRAREVAKWFGGVRDSVLAEHDWNFAADWILPAAAATAPTPGPWTKRYPLPEDIIAVRAVQGSTNEDLGPDAWEMMKAPTGELKVLYTNAAPALVKVTRRITSPRLWEPLFLDVFILRLAAAIAPKILKSNTLADKLDAKADEKISLAKKVDAREAAGSTITRDTTWVSVRGAGRSSRG